MKVGELKSPSINPGPVSHGATHSRPHRSVGGHFKAMDEGNLDTSSVRGCFLAPLRFLIQDIQVITRRRMRLYRCHAHLRTPCFFGAHIADYSIWYSFELCMGSTSPSSTIVHAHAHPAEKDFVARPKRPRFVGLYGQASYVAIISVLATIEFV